MDHSAPIGFWRRIVSLIYEFLILLAIIFIVSFIFLLIFRDPNAAYHRPLYQLYLVVIMGYYFTWFWTRSGQTLAMQTWRLRVITANGERLSMLRAIARYFLALSGILFFGCGLFWAFFDQDHQYLHDRLAGTRIIKIVE